MKNLGNPAKMVQILRCDHGELSFAINKADVLSIQRTERFNYLDQSDESSDLDWLSELEQSRFVIGWISDGVRKIRICHMDSVGFGSGQEPSTLVSQLGESARIILFTPAISQKSDGPQTMTPPWGLLIDRVQGLVDVPRAHFHATSPMLLGSTASPFRSLARFEGEVLMILDPQRVNPFRKPTASTDISAALQDDHHMARLAAAMQVSEKLPGTEADKPVARGLVVFSLGRDIGDGRDVSLGFSISQVAEILESASVKQVPSMPGYIGRVIFWRDIAVPIVDIAARMGLSSSGDEEQRAEAKRYVIVRHPLRINGNDPDGAGPDKYLIFAALGVNSEVRILRLPLANRPSSRQLPIKSEWVRGQVELESETLVIPDMQALLPPQSA
jgi:chemotaxis signal transduction protein